MRCAGMLAVACDSSGRRLLVVVTNQVIRAASVSPDLYACIHKRVEHLADPALTGIAAGTEVCCTSNARRSDRRREVCADSVHVDTLTVSNDDRNRAACRGLLIVRTTTPAPA